MGWLKQRQIHLTVKMDHSRLRDLSGMVSIVSMHPADFHLHSASPTTSEACPVVRERWPETYLVSVDKAIV